MTVLTCILTQASFVSADKIPLFGSDCDFSMDAMSARFMNDFKISDKFLKIRKSYKKYFLPNSSRWKKIRIFVDIFLFYFRASNFNLTHKVHPQSCMKIYILVFIIFVNLNQSIQLIQLKKDIVIVFKNLNSTTICIKRLFINKIKINCVLPC